MATKLSSGQMASLAVLDTFVPKFDQIHRLIEEMATLKADVSQVRRLSRMLDEMKAAANAIGESGLSDTCGVMAMLVRRTGGLHMRVRSLRDSYVGLKTNFEGAYKRASTPEGAPAKEDAANQGG